MDQFQKLCCLLMSVFCVSYHLQIFALPYFSTFIGINFIRTDRTTVVNINKTEMWSHSYTDHSPYRIAPLVGIRTGGLWHYPTCAMYLGLGLEGSYARFSNGQDLTHLVFTKQPNLAILNFNYLINSFPLLLVGQWGWLQSWWQPYLIAGLGVSWNEASRHHAMGTILYKTTPSIYALFRPYTSLDFAYLAGLGLGFEIKKGIMLGLEYRFTHYGHAYLKTTTLQWNSQYLLLGNIYAHAALLQVTISGANYSPH